MSMAWCAYKTCTLVNGHKGDHMLWKAPTPPVPDPARYLDLDSEEGKSHDARIAAEAVAPWIAAMKRVHDSGACGITERDLRGSRCDCGYLQLHGDLLNKRLTQADKPAAVTPEENTE